MNSTFIASRNAHRNSLNTDNGEASSSEGDNSERLLDADQSLLNNADSILNNERNDDEQESNSHECIPINNGVEESKCHDNENSIFLDEINTMGIQNPVIGDVASSESEESDGSEYEPSSCSDDDDGGHRKRRRTSRNKKIILKIHPDEYVRRADGKIINCAAGAKYCNIKHHRDRSGKHYY